MLMSKPFSAPHSYHSGGPMYILLSKLITIKNVEQLGFVDVNEANLLLEKAFTDQDAAAMRAAIVLGQWIVLSQSFGIPRAAPEVSPTLHRLLATTGLDMVTQRLEKWTMSQSAVMGAMRCLLKYVRLMY